MDVAGWLRSLGMSRYEAAFRQNEIDGEVLPKLTAEDLKELGVVAIGHRRTILSATGLLSAPLTPALQSPKVCRRRRRLTVMFCDLVDSTALAAQLDPEGAVWL